MKNKKFFKREFPLIILSVAILVYLFIFREDFIQGVKDAISSIF